MYRIKFPEQEFALFLDVGLSHNAPNSAQVLEAHSNAFVIGFEPNPNSCERVRALDLGERFYLIEAGVANVEGQPTMPFNIIAEEKGDITDQGTSSFREPSTSFTESGYTILETREVPVVALRDILDLVPWERVARGTFAMKSDTQGFEEEVVASLGNYVERMALLQIESSTAGQYEDASQHENVIKMLEPHMTQANNDGWNAWFTKKR